MNRLLHILAFLSLFGTVSAQDPGTIETIAGGGLDTLGTNIPATDALLNGPSDIAVDADGNLYVADTFSHIIRRIDAESGVMTTIAGTGIPGFSGDGGPATDAQLNLPRAVAVGPLGEILIGDTRNFRLRRIDPATGIITTLAGRGFRGIPPQIGKVHVDSLQFGEIVSIFAGTQTILIGDGLNFENGEGNNQILQVAGDSAEVIAGTGNLEANGDGGNAVDAGLSIEGIGFADKLVFADAQNHQIRSLELALDDEGFPFTLIDLVAGNGARNPITGAGTLSGDGGPATEAGLDLPAGVSGGPDGRIYIMDTRNHRVRSVEPDGTIVTIAGIAAGNDELGNFSGDGGLALNAELAQPYRSVITPDGDLVFIDLGNNRIRRIHQPDFRTSLLDASASVFNFGPVSLGVGALRTLTLSNFGNQSLDITSLTIDNPLFSTDFQTPTDLNPNQSRTVEIRFIPENEDPVEGTLILLTTDPFLPRIEIPLTGSGIVPDIDVLPKELVFTGTFTDQTRDLRLRVSNLTRGELFINEAVLSDTINFALSQTLDGVRISAGNSQDINVRFQPSVPGPFSATLRIFSNDPDEPEFVIPLSGLGREPKPGGFVNLADSLGVADPGASFGVAWSDYDGDGDPDLYVVKSQQPNRLYRNDGTVFTDVAAQVGVADAGDGSGGAWADYDGDGDLDLYVTNFGQPNCLFRNDGGMFTEVSEAAGVNDAGDGFGAAWADTDRDGDPDLYVANFGDNVFYRNLGNGTFEEIADQLGIADSSSGIQPVFADFNNDQHPDLFLANSGPNRLWWNNGDGTFTDGSTAFFPQDAGASTGAAVGDFNNDGFLDLYVPYFGTNRLYENRSGTGFADVALSLGVADQGNSRGAVWGDFDNDGFLDLFVTNRSSENKIFRNVDGNSQFQEVGESFGVNTSADSRGVALADFDGDGGLDMFVAIQNDPDQLFRNQEAEGNWIVVTPLGTTSSFDAIGTRIVVVYDRVKTIIREIAGGTSFLSQDALSASFGVGEATSIDALNIRWPSGIFQRFEPVEIGINRVLRVEEIAPLPPVDILIETTSDVIVANGTAQTDISVTLLNAEGEVSLVSDRSIRFVLDIGGGILEPSGPNVVDGVASARFTAGTQAFTAPLTISVAGLPSERIFLELLPPLTGNDATIETIVGRGTSGFSGDGGKATDAELNIPRAVATNASGDIYIADTSNNRVRCVDAADSVITTVAGSGAVGFGNIVEGPALLADVGAPRGILIDPAGDLIVSESGGQRIRRVNLATGITTAFAGAGFSGFSGDGGPATEANMTGPRGITIDGQGRTYLTEFFNNAVRVVENGIIETIAGDPLEFFGFADGVPATQSSVTFPSGVAVDGEENLYIAETGSHRIRRVTPDGIISTLAGDGSAGASGEGGPAQFLKLDSPEDVAYDPAGRLYVSDTGNQRVLAIDLETGIAQTVAGSGATGSNGDQGDAINFSLNEPGGLAVASDGTLLIADARNNRILRLTVQFQDAAPPIDLPPIDPGNGDGSPDFNGDGRVDFVDFLGFAGVFNTNSVEYDLDGDGFAGFSDFLIFANAFGRPTASNPAYGAPFVSSRR